MRVDLLTREYPPDVYGGAGVHVEYLARELAKLVDVRVHAWGADRPGARPPVHAYRAWDALGGEAPHLAALRAMSIDLAMAAGTEGADVVHSHTWYANLGGHLSKLVHDVPHVATVHSLEPLRPWKAEQLGGGYALSSWCERTALEGADAVIAVSQGMRRDVLECYPGLDPARVRVVYNGVDPARPSVVFVGRITRQKGVAHLLRAALRIDPEAQLVLAAGAPDTPEIAAEVTERMEQVRAERGNMIWLQEMLPKPDVIQLLSHATVFVCPSIYEPLGIVNLEAMACEAAVVASAVGGIVEVVEDGTTGLLVPFEPVDDGTQEPADPERFAADFAAAVNALLADPARAKEMGKSGRRRVVERFSWPAIARETVSVYEGVAGG